MRERIKYLWVPLSCTSPLPSLHQSSLQSTCMKQDRICLHPQDSKGKWQWKIGDGDMGREGDYEHRFERERKFNFLQGLKSTAAA